jgi:hypothetical protein
MVIVSADRYLDLRSPAWSSFEQAGRIRFEGGLVVAQMPDATEEYLNEHAPALTIAEAQLITDNWKGRHRHAG